MIRYAKAMSSLGPFVVAASDRGLAMMEFGEIDVQARFPDAGIVEDSGALAETLFKLAALIEDPVRDIDLALDLQGAELEVKVWQALREIPVGTTSTYGEIATRLGVSQQAREVGEACGNNRLAVVVPCHRIVRKDGSLAGYRWGIRRKRTLLEREHRACLLRPFVAVPHARAHI